MATLLLVDDDADLSETLKDLFEMLDHKVDVAADGSGALALLGVGKEYDLIMLDWQLPDMPGIDVCKKYRDDNGQAPILLLTGMRDADSLSIGKNAGANAVLTKPFTVDQVVAKVESILQAP
jgi:two-component system, OmpR family, manganese sensing response regulator